MKKVQIEEKKFFEINKRERSLIAGELREKVLRVHLQELRHVMMKDSFDECSTPHPKGPSGRSV